MPVSQIYVAPGNGGTAQSLNKVSNVPIGVENFPGLVNFSKMHDINLVVPGPEVPLVTGITDYFKNGNRWLFMLVFQHMLKRNSDTQYSCLWPI